MSKVFKTISLLLSVAALFSFVLPLFSTVCGEIETQHVVLRGWNLPEFSPWGVLTVFAPILLCGLLASPLPDRWKTVLLLALIVGVPVSYTQAVHAALAWMRTDANTYIQYHYGLAVYPQWMLLAILTGHLSLYKLQRRTCYKYIKQ